MTPESSAPRVWTERVSSRSFDIWHEVQLVPQLTGMSCWAAAAAMLIGWRDAFPIDADEVARGAGRFEAYRDGLHPSDVHALAGIFGLHIESMRPWSVPALRTLLEVHGPLWVGEASPGLHSIVVIGAHGDGSLDGTRVRINDPWPIGRGERYSISVRKFLDNFDAATRAVGAHAQLLHCGGTGRGARRISEQRSVRSRTTISAPARPPVASAPLAPSPVTASGLGTVAAGERYVSTHGQPNDPLRGHDGTGDNLFLRWTSQSDALDAVDVVVHLHGFTTAAPSAAMLRQKVRDSGLVFDTPEGQRSRPSLGIVPRGRKITADEFARAQERVAELRRRFPNRTFSDARSDVYTFPALLRGHGEGLRDLVAWSLREFQTQVLRRSRAVGIGRVVLTAHSGGGRPLSELLGSHERFSVCNAHEVHVFDAFYAEPAGLRAWLGARLAQRPEEGALRVFYGGGTRTYSEALRPLLPAPPSPLSRRYRAEFISTPHGQVARHHGPALLRDVSA